MLPARTRTKTLVGNVWSVSPQDVKERDPVPAEHGPEPAVNRENILESCLLGRKVYASSKVGHIPSFTASWRMLQLVTSSCHR